MAVKDALINEFKFSAGFLNVSDLTAAEAALSALWDAAVQPVLDNDRLLIPYFPTHGGRHVHQLAVLFNRLLPHVKDNVSQKLRNSDFLVLLYAAFIMHDIGMSELSPADAAACCNDLFVNWKERGSRSGHHTRSLQRIESLLLDPQGQQLASWMAYWNYRDNWPTPVPRYAALLLARICQSHHDPMATWLKPTALSRYSLQTGEAPISFEIAWRRAYEETIAPLVQAASALLCLLDLSDIGARRFPSFENEQGVIDNAAVPERRDDLFVTFLHWLGHQRATINFEVNSNKLVVACDLQGWDNNSPLRTLLFTHCGPVQMLLEFGMKEQLRQALHDSAHIPFAGITVRQGYANAIWDAGIQQELQKPALAGINLYRQTNDLIKPGTSQTLDGDLVHPFAFGLISERLFSDDLKQVSPTVSTLLRLRKAGLMVDHLYNVSEQFITEKKRAYMVSVQMGTSVHQLDGLLASLRFALLLASSLLKADSSRAYRPEPLSIRLASRGNSLHGTLVEGRFSDWSNQIILVDVDEAGKYERLFERIAEDVSTAPFVVLFGSDESRDRLLRAHGDKLAHISAVAYDAVVLKLTTEFTQLVDQIRRAEDAEKRSTVAPPVPITSPAQLLLHAYSQAVGFHRLVEWIHGAIDDGSQIDKREAMSMLLLATTFELMHLSARIGVPYNRFSQMYEQIAREFPTENAIDKNSESVIRKAKMFGFDRDRADQVILCDGGDAEDLSKSLRELRVRSRKALLTQLTVLYRLQSLGEPYNVNSLLAQDAIEVYQHERILKQLCNSAREFIEKAEANSLGGAAELEEALHLLLGLADNLAKHPEVTIEAVARFWSALSASPRHDLASWFEVALFQAAYQHYRTLRKTNRMEELWKAVYNFSLPVQLGCLEAIASGDDSGDDTFRKLEGDLVEEITTRFCTATALQSHPAAAVMAYDIVAKFRKKRPDVMRQASELSKVGEQEQWNQFCEYLHTAAPDADPPKLLHESVVKWMCPWVKARGVFHRIIQSVASHVFKREVLDPEMLTRFARLESIAAEAVNAKQPDDPEIPTEGPSGA